MRRLWRWPGLLAVLVLALVAAGTAVVGSRAPSDQRIVTSPLAAAGLGAHTPEQPSTTVTTLAPTPSTTTAPTTSTTTKAAPTTRPLAPPTVPTTATPPTMPPRVAATPGSADQYPSSWTLAANGISIKLRMEPARPHVGDTVTLSIESAATVPTDYCCELRVFVGPDSQMVYQRLPGPGPCPLVQGPTADRATFVVDHAGVVGFRVLASRDMLCSPPPQMASAPLDASTWVYPAGE